jgi:uncharacterized protein (DUF3820 family)
VLKVVNRQRQITDIYLSLSLSASVYLRIYYFFNLSSNAGHHRLPVADSVCSHGEKVMPIFEVWIETGATNGQYTLHKRSATQPMSAFAPDYTYVQNIGRTWERACAKADLICSTQWEGIECLKEYDVDDERGTLRKPGQYDETSWNLDILWFGKYKGMRFDTILDLDPEYLKWVRDEMHAGDGKKIALVKKIESLDLGEREYVIKKVEWDHARAIEDDLDRMGSQFVGEVGERRVFNNLIVKFETDWETDFGTTYLYGLKGPDGNVIMIKSSRWLEIERGDEVTIKATIKEHFTNDNGVKQTFVNRAKVEELINEA